MLYSVILPTYNERENLPIIYYLLDKVFNEANLSYEVVIVDDSSPDNTLEVARAIQKSYGKKHVQIVSRKGIWRPKGEFGRFGRKFVRSGRKFGRSG